jgi:predicted HicB family RNase H-like nuclease
MGLRDGVYLATSRPETGSQATQRNRWPYGSMSPPCPDHGSSCTMDVSELPNIAKAVNRWLSYQILCGREALLSESYLGHLVAEYLIHKHSGQFEAEVDHPVLNQPRPGRPKQIDYVLRTRDNHVMEMAIECKWISGTPYDRQRILNDILRLECVRVPDRHVKRFLLVAGSEEDFEKNFRGLKVNVGGKRAAFTTTFLPFLQKAGDVVISSYDCQERFREFYKSFSSSFNAGVPKSFKTRLVGKRTADEISVCIWQISSVSHRATFSPEVEWV